MWDVSVRDSALTASLVKFIPGYYYLLLLQLSVCIAGAMLNDGGHKLWSVTEFLVLVDNHLHNEMETSAPRSFFSRMEDDKLLLGNNVSYGSDREEQREYNLAPMV